MLVGRNEVVDSALRKEGEPAFSANPLPTNKLTCTLFHYSALTQLVEVCFRVKAFSASLPASSSVERFIVIMHRDLPHSMALATSAWSWHHAGVADQARNNWRRRPVMPLAARTPRHLYFSG